ncbi:MAG: GatB/YqeY domain-containing protein [Candidatus Pacebacteria bacterium]|nr:GatB/YqeY domain-containing protein [Candidatus Paceibacterota bacterium]
MLQEQINPVRNKKPEISVISNGIKKDLKEAMLIKDMVKMTVLRGLLAEFVNELIVQKKKPQDEVSDEIALAVIKKAVKQRKDSIKQFEKGDRQDLVEVEKAELEILKKYLPEMMNADTIKKIALAKKDELGIKDPSKMGILIGAVMKEIKIAGSDADGAEVKKIVENLF